MSPSSSTEHPPPGGESVPSQPEHLVNTFALLGPGSEALPTAGSAQQIRDGLLQFMSSALPSWPASHIANSCIDLYLQYTFPAAPMVHEPTLRASSSRFFSDPCDADLFSGQTYQEVLTHMEGLRTPHRPLCIGLVGDAGVSTAVPANSRDALSQSIPRATQRLSRIMISSTLILTSIVTRILRRLPLWNISRERRHCRNHVLGQANLLIRSMRLYSEEALENLSAVEAQLLRNVFWQMYAADRGLYMPRQPPASPPRATLSIKNLPVRPSAVEFASPRHDQSLL